MAKIKTKYVCQSCGYETTKWLGKCPECTKWNTFVEEIVDKKTISKGKVNTTVTKPQTLSSIATDEEKRTSSGMPELDRVLGGGIVVFRHFRKITNLGVKYPITFAE